MKTQIITIHGGETFGSYEVYIAWLMSFEIDLNYADKKGWKDDLKEKLEGGFEIVQPEMPNWMNAKYLEWKIHFEKYLPFINGDAVFIGHSLGGIFLAKYFSENDYPKKVKGIFMLAAPYDKVSSTDDMADFVLSNDLSKLASYGDKVYLYHSKDDPIVPFSHLTQYQKQLPMAKVRILENMGHFRVEEIPELIEDIKNI